MKHRTVSCEMLQQVYKLQYVTQHHSALLSVSSLFVNLPHNSCPLIDWPMQPKYLSFCHNRIWKKKAPIFCRYGYAEERDRRD